MAACDFGLQRSSFMGLHRLRPFGLATDCGSSDIWSSESMEPVRAGATRANGMHEFLFKLDWVAKRTEKGGGVDTGVRVIRSHAHDTHDSLVDRALGGNFGPLWLGIARISAWVFVCSYRSHTFAPGTRIYFALASLGVCERRAFNRNARKFRARLLRPARHTQFRNLTPKHVCTHAFLAERERERERYAHQPASAPIKTCHIYLRVRACVCVFALLMRVPARHACTITYPRVAVVFFFFGCWVGSFGGAYAFICVCTN